MKNIRLKYWLIAGTAGISCLIAGTSISSPSKNLKTDNSKASYTIGYDLGYNYRGANGLIDKDALIDGLDAGLQGDGSYLSKEEMSSSMAALQKNILEKIAKDNYEKSSKFIADIAKKKNVNKITDGLYYSVDTNGNGDNPKLSDTITVKFQGKLANDYVFYDSLKYNVPENLVLSNAIPGWQKAIVKMSKGSVWTIYLSPELGYGTNAPANIGPNQALIYKIELIDFKPSN